MLFLALILSITKLAYTAEKFFLSADSISKNEENNTIKAEGNVNITNNNYKLKANEITYYLKEKKVFEKVWNYRSTFGGIIDPMSAYLILRSLKTFDSWMISAGT